MGIVFDVEAYNEQLYMEYQNSLADDYDINQIAYHCICCEKEYDLEFLYEYATKSINNGEEGLFCEQCINKYEEL
jgi:hypothetical protein